VTYSVTKETRFTRGGAASWLEDAKPGERAAVHGEKRGGTLDALLVKLGPPGAGAPTSPER
jgi:hypothetical protein